MYYYEVLVGDMRYHGKSALTYACDQAIEPGQVVRIALRSRAVLGIVRAKVSEPSFDVKPIAAVAAAPPIPKEVIALLDWVYAYYPAPFGSVIRQFLPPSTAFPKPSKKTSAVHGKLHKLPPLTAAQQRALSHIEPTGYHLLHGITGSGKTRIYLELAQQTLANHKSAIILTPEIGLTAQLIEQFVSVFPKSVHVIHSRQTAAERRDIWYQLLAAEEPVVVIGPRSALFAPVRNVGLIVIDESHDQAYKNENAPHYRTERVAAQLARLHGARLISGSATPNVEEYYVAAAKSRPIIRLDSLARTSTSTVNKHRIGTVDMRERTNFRRSQILSEPLLEALYEAMQHKEQSLLFLNRRGTAGAVMCANCGWQALCTHCDLPLTYHGDVHITRCHTCGRTWQMRTSCPECSHTDLLLKSVGTKAVVEEIRRLMPQARLKRFDSDVEKSEQLEKQLSALQSGDVDIIIGTQMITKGLDLPHLSVVGILNADSSLLIPDFVSAERTYQLLSQVIGRAGRGHLAHSTVLLQTYNPGSELIRAAMEQDWEAFYQTQLAERRQFNFPPFAHVVKLTCLRATDKAAETAAQSLSQLLRKAHANITIEGPSPAFHPKEGSKYKWQLVVKSPSRQALVAITKALPSGWQHNLDPISLL